MPLRKSYISNKKVQPKDVCAPETIWSDDAQMGNVE